MDKAPLTEHLGELRNRIFIALGVVIVAFGVSFNYSEHIFTMLTSPIHNTVHFSLTNPFITFTPNKHSNMNLVFLAPAEAVWMHIKISFISAFIVSSPVIFFEIWRFIAPGLLGKGEEICPSFCLYHNISFPDRRSFLFYYYPALCNEFSA